MLLVSRILGACAAIAGEGLDHQVLDKKGKSQTWKEIIPV